MERRDFTNRIGLLWMAVATGTITFTSGCSALQDIADWGPTFNSALNSIVALVESVGITISGEAQTILGAITSEFAQLIALAKQYESTQPVPTSVTTEIYAFLTDLVAAIPSFIAALPLGTNPIVSLVAGLVSIVISTLLGFLERIPAPPPSILAAVAKAKTMRVGTLNIPLQAHQRSHRQFVRDFNAPLKAAGEKRFLIPESLWDRL